MSHFKLSFRGGGWNNLAAEETLTIWPYLRIYDKDLDWIWSSGKVPIGQPDLSADWPELSDQCQNTKLLRYIRAKTTLPFLCFWPDVRSLPIVTPDLSNIQSLLHPHTSSPGNFLVGAQNTVMQDFPSHCNSQAQRLSVSLQDQSQNELTETSMQRVLYHVLVSITVRLNSLASSLRVYQRQQQRGLKGR